MNLDPPTDLQADRLAPPPPDAAAWTDLEQAFFASAPPDDAEPPAEPSIFDDLGEVPIRDSRPGSRRTIAIALAAIAMVIGLGLSAAVFAAR